MNTCIHADTQTCAKKIQIDLFEAQRPPSRLSDSPDAYRYSSRAMMCEFLIGLNEWNIKRWSEQRGEQNKCANAQE